MSEQLVEEFEGEVPTTYEELRYLRGVGDYIASAVCCFRYRLPIIVVDTNTVRIMGRLFGIVTNAESRRNKQIRDLHNWVLDIQNPREYNYGLLDLGAMICLPKNPYCDICPLSSYCIFNS